MSISTPFPTPPTKMYVLLAFSNSQRAQKQLRKITDYWRRRCTAIQCRFLQEEPRGDFPQPGSVLSLNSEESLDESQGRWGTYPKDDTGIFLKYSSGTWKRRASMWLLSPCDKTAIKTFAFPLARNSAYVTQLWMSRTVFRFQRAGLSPLPAPLCLGPLASVNTSIACHQHPDWKGKARESFSRGERRRRATDSSALKAGQV